MPSFFKRSLLPKLRGFPLSNEAIEVLPSADAYRRCLLEKIAQAQPVSRSAFTCNGRSGHEVFDALMRQGGRPELICGMGMAAPHAAYRAGNHLATALVPGDDPSIRKRCLLWVAGRPRAF